MTNEQKKKLENEMEYLISESVYNDGLVDEYMGMKKALEMLGYTISIGDELNVIID